MRASEVKLSYKRDSKGIVVTNSGEVENVLRSFWDEESLDYYESFVVMYLSRKNEVLGIMEVSIGSIEACIVDGRIFQGALLTNSSSIILAHNHPSGGLRPSTQDLNITKEIKAASEFLKIKLLDHLILTTESYYSFADDGLI